MDRNFTVYPLDTNVNEGDAMRLMCYIKSSPNAQIFWQKNGSTLPNDRRFDLLLFINILFYCLICSNQFYIFDFRYYIFSNSLLIINTQISDSGDYR